MMKMLAPATLIWQLSDVLLISGIKKCLAISKLGTLCYEIHCKEKLKMNKMYG